MSRPELRGTESFYDVNHRLPEDDRQVTVRARDANGDYTLPFAVYRKNGVWLNAKFGKPLMIAIVKWRY
jgi:hypothetical protein